MLLPKLFLIFRHIHGENLQNDLLKSELAFPRLFLLKRSTTKEILISNAIFGKNKLIGANSGKKENLNPDFLVNYIVFSHVEV